MTKEVKQIVIHFTTSKTLRVNSNLLEKLSEMEFNDDLQFLMIEDSEGDKHLINLREVTHIETV